MEGPYFIKIRQMYRGVQMFQRGSKFYSKISSGGSIFFEKLVPGGTNLGGSIFAVTYLPSGPAPPFTLLPPSRPTHTHYRIVLFGGLVWVIFSASVSVVRVFSLQLLADRAFIEWLTFQDLQNLSM